MVVTANVKQTIEIDIDKLEAFRVLLRTLNMEFILDEDNVFFVKKNGWGELEVWKKAGSWAYESDTLYDSRGDLFVALRNVAVNLCPNLIFRGDDYIYNKD